MITIVIYYIQNKHTILRDGGKQKSCVQHTHTRSVFLKLSNLSFPIYMYMKYKQHSDHMTISKAISPSLNCVCASFAMFILDHNTKEIVFYIFFLKNLFGPKSLYMYIFKQMKRSPFFCSCFIVILLFCLVALCLCGLIN